MQTRKGPVRTPPDAGNRSRPLRISAIVTTFFPNSHAGVIVDKFLRGFPTDEGVIPSRSTAEKLKGTVSISVLSLSSASTL